MSTATDNRYVAISKLLLMTVCFHQYFSVDVSTICSVTANEHSRMHSMILV